MSAQRTSKGGSKIMESDSIMNIVEDKLRGLFFIIDDVVNDNSIIKRSVPKHSSIFTCGQVLKSSKGKLDE